LLFEPEQKTKYFRSRYSPIGLDLGHAQIKMLQLKRSENDLYLHQKVIFPTPEGSMKGGCIADPELLVKHLKSVNQKTGWHGRQVNLCLNSDACNLHIVRMPRMTIHELNRAMHLEAERLFHYKTGQAVVAHTLINNKNHNGLRFGEYLLTAVSKEIVAAYTAVTVESGLTPLSLGVKPLTLLQSVQYVRTAGLSESHSPFVLVDFGSESTLILIAGSDGYLFHKSINIGLDHFIEKVQSREALNRISAQRRIYSGESLAHKGLLDIADRLTRSVAQTLEYFYENQSPAEIRPPKTISACGGCIFIPGLAAHLQNNLNMKLVLFKPFRCIKGSGKSNFTISDNEGALFSVAQGLALQGWTE
jgi:type IV pilus assembly protein PilM